jgi:hypothetical protein
MNHIIRDRYRLLGYTYKVIVNKIYSKQRERERERERESERTRERTRDRESERAIKPMPLRA